MKKALSKYNLISAAILTGITANASVIYTDVDPDETFSNDGDTYEIDFNSDNNIDVTIYISSGSGAGTYNYGGFPLSYSFQNNIVGVSAGTNGILASVVTSTSSSGSTNTSAQFKPMRANETVSSDQSFISSYGSLIGFNQYAVGFGGAPFFSNSGVEGNFNDTIFDRFMGVKFKEGNTDLFGWVRLRSHAEKGEQFFTIFDYAYEDNGAAIKAGAGIVSPGSLSLNDDLAFNNLKAYNVGGQLKVISDDRINGTVSLLGLSGKTVKTEVMNSNELLINTNGLANGTYIVQVITDNKQQSIKVIL